jgi:cell division protease FtsH
VAQWNAANYLSGTLSAIRKTFADARKVAPCVLLIDELDGISDRARLTGEYVEYWTQIVNCLLEELAGVSGRDGVVVIGCSNHPDKIDPAIRRAGRLDREVRVDLPSAEDLASIFRHHLGSEVLAGADLMPLAVRAGGKSGADVEAFCRRAKASARRAKRDLTLDDLLAEIAGKDVEPLTDEFRRTLSVHEAGHAAVAVAVGYDVAWMKIDATGGITMMKAPDKVPTLATVGQEMAVLLAGRAAERMILGTVAIPANSPENDLARATMEALKLETVSGQGLSGLVHVPAVTLDSLLFARNADLHQAVRARLDAAEKAAGAIVERHRPAVEALAAKLAAESYVGRDTILAIAADHGLKPGCEGGAS